MDFTDVEQAPYITPQTATVSDEAVQAALDKCENVDWVQGLFGTGLFGQDVVKGMLIAALPHLALTAAPCSVEVKKLEWVNDAAEVKSLGLSYHIDLSDDETDVAWYALEEFSNCEVSGSNWSKDQAKAEAQADFDRRILSQIVTKPVDVAAVHDWWLVKWYGSEPMKGASIWSATKLGTYGENLVHIGSDKKHLDLARDIADAHNAAMRALSPAAPVRDCECATIQQDEHRPVGYPSLLCETSPVPVAKPLTQKEIIGMISDIEKELNNLGRRSLLQRVSDWLKNG